MKLTVEPIPEKDKEENKYPVLLESREKTAEGETLFIVLVSDKKLLMLPSFDEIHNSGTLEDKLESGAWKVSDKRIIISND